MSVQQSFVKVENELQPQFRRMINEAESTEDVKKFFNYSMQELLNQAFEGQLNVGFEDIELVPEKEPPFRLSDQIHTHSDFDKVWNASDLSNIVGRFALLARNHYKRLATKPEKTEAKMRRSTPAGA